MATFPRAPLVERVFQRPGPALDWIHPTPLALFNLNKKPFAQYDWPVPPKRAEAVTWVWGNPGIYTNVRLFPFNQYDWPVPVGRTPPALDWLWGKPGVYTNPIPFKQRDWPIPFGPRSPAIDSFERNVTLLGIQPAIRPKTLYDWTVPFARTGPALGWTWPTNLELYKNPFPFNQTDWPTPKEREVAGGWIQEVNLALLSAQPFVQTDWPVPLGRVGVALDWIWPTNPNLYTNPIPFKQSDWPVPPGLGKASDWTSFNLNLYPNPFPFAQYSWPTVPGPNPPAGGWILSVPEVILASIANPPVISHDWTVPTVSEFLVSLRTVTHRSLPLISVSVGGLPVIRENWLRTNPWSIQLPSSNVLWHGLIPMIQCAYVGYGLPTDAVEVYNIFGKLVARLSGRADLGSVRTGRISWVDGLVVPSLLQNGGNNLPSGRLLIYFR